MKSLIFAALITLSNVANAHWYNSLATKLEGNWSLQHTIAVLEWNEEEEADWVEHEAENTIKIEKVSRKKIKFELDAWFTNGHSCYMEGTAKKMGKKFIYTEKTYDDKICKLEIFKNAQGELELKDQEGNCKWNNCGMRGYIDGLTFPERN